MLLVSGDFFLIDVQGFNGHTLTTIHCLLTFNRNKRFKKYKQRLIRQ